MSGNHIAEHFGKGLEPSEQDPGSGAAPGRPLSVNVIFTNPESTMTALRAAESFVRDLRSTVHIRAMIGVPHQLAMDYALVSVQFFQRLLCDLVERVGSGRCQYVLHIYICRNRIETLLRVLRPSSLVVIGGRRRFWPTAEGRLWKAAIDAGHSVAFIDARAF